MTFWAQLRVLFQLLFTVYIPTCFALCLLFIVAWQHQIPVLHFTQDPTTIMGAPFYIGLLSNVGILLWSATASICFFNYIFLRKYSCNKEWSSFFLFASAITFVLLCDDLFLFHEVFYIEYLNISEEVVLLVYATTVLYFLIKFRKTILQTEYMLLFIAFVFFILSTIFDMKLFGNHIFIEDSLKMLGIVSWCAYFTRVNMKQLKWVVSLQQADNNDQRKNSGRAKSTLIPEP